MARTSLILAHTFFFVVGAAAKLAHVHFIHNSHQDPLIHYSDEHGAKAPLFPSQLTESIARVMGVHSPVGSSFSNLPAGNVFNPPKMNILLALEGTSELPMPATESSGGGATHSFPVNRMARSPHPLVLEALGEGAPASPPGGHFAGQTALRCAGAALADAQACAFAEGGAVAPARGALCRGPLPAGAAAAARRAGYELRALAPGEGQGEGEGGCQLAALSGGAAAGADLEFDMGDPVEAAFFEELAMLAELPGRWWAGREAGASGDRGAAGRPVAFDVVSVGSLEGLAARARRGGGAAREKAAAAAAVVDAAVAALLESAYAAFPGGVTGQVLRTPPEHAAAAGHGYAPWQKPHRFLAEGDRALASSNSTGNYTLTEIRDYQIALWTAVLLVAVLLAALLLTACMDVEADSILYAKFQADTAGLKAD